MSPAPVAPAPVNPAPRRGWCPGLARPMPTGDGLLVRLHPVAGRLGADQVRAAARAAREGGNGLLDATARGNLQIRGVTAESHGRVVAILGEAGLGDLRHDGGPQRLTLNAPLAGADGLAVVAAVEAIGREIAGLPAKTLVAVEDPAGGLGPVEADVWVRLIPGSSGITEARGIPSPEWEMGRGDRRSREGGALQDKPPRVELRSSTSSALFGSRATLARSSIAPTPLPLGRGDPAPIPGTDTQLSGDVDVRRESLPALQLAVATPDGPYWLAPLPAPVALATLRTLLDGLAASGARRMRALSPPQRDALLADLTPGEAPPATTALPAGLHGRTLLAELPFGRCDAALLDRIAGWSESHGDGHLALTPGRGIALTAYDEPTADTLRNEVEAVGLIVDPADSRRSVAACPGAPACASGGTPAQADAHRLAAAFAPLAGLSATAHVSGCPKGCALPGPATLTLVGRADGRYGVVLEGNAGAETDLVLTFGAVLERLESVRVRPAPDVASDLRDAFREPA
ncbi:nitrite reductase [Methylobacterium sp. 17Sr1-1]|uniref:nitrite reductase n=1 Tax=Methylobacterium sp. 17Sr1-1 TaxID=2202826 RepID=UPI000D70153D|nr:nitrite reductase [Methylobacterium sp. 17Sr1-1]AWN52059.1 nitrite reductase [Methylobacterium sp. 17Sr1-1]